MARQRSPNREKARRMFLNSKGTKKPKEIAEKLGVKPSQVRKWKSLDKWDDDLIRTLPKGTITEKKRNVPKKDITQV